MTELGKIEKPEAKSFTAKRKLYVIPILPFEEFAMEFEPGHEKVERFWGEVIEKIDYFVTTYGNISVLYIEGVNKDDKVGIEFFEKYGKESNYYRLVKSLVERGAVIRGIEEIEYITLTKLLFDEYSKSFLSETKELHQGFYGKNIDFEGWRNYLIKRIQDTHDEIGKIASRLIGELPAETNGILIITDGRPIEYPEGMDVFQIRPPAFDEIARKIRERTK